MTSGSAAVAAKTGGGHLPTTQEFLLGIIPDSVVGRPVSSGRSAVGLLLGQVRVPPLEHRAHCLARRRRLVRLAHRRRQREPRLVDAYVLSRRFITVTGSCAPPAPWSRRG